jgi:hypothetical protein
VGTLKGDEDSRAAIDARSHGIDAAIDDDDVALTQQVTPTRSRPSMDVSAHQLAAAQAPQLQQVSEANLAATVVVTSAADDLSAGLPAFGGSPGLRASLGTTGEVAAAGLPAEIQRLLRRKSDLLATGAYAPDDPLISQIEARVAVLAGLS